MGEAVKHSLTSRVLKALGIFGGIEVVTMACSVVRTKLVALWIGAAGVGVISLYNATMEMLRGMMQLNLRQSAVRQIAAASDEAKPVEIIATRSVGLIIGILTSIITAAIAPLLSRITFDSTEYTWGFVALAATMFATAVSAGRSAILQGLGNLRALARATMWASLVSTAAAIVLFYLFGAAAIVPVLVLFPFCTLFFLILQPCPKAACTIEKSVISQAARNIMKLGGWLTVAAGVTLVADYVLRVYLNFAGSIDTVGVFQAGYTIVNTYIGVAFTAISMEFYPRLSSTINRPYTTRILVAHEISLVTWIILPAVMVFLSADRLIVNILYSDAFTAIIPYMNIAVTATTLRGFSWCMAYVILAKGDGRAYVVTETLSCVVMLGAAIPLWHLWGYVGLGVAYLVEFAAYTIITGVACRVRYGLTMPRSVMLTGLGAPLLAGLGLLLKTVAASWAPLLLLPFILPVTWRVLRR